MSEEQDGRLTFMEAVARVMRHRQPAFSAVPVFGEGEDEEQVAEGARVFIIEPDPEGDDWRMRFIAGPFFANVHAANEIFSPEEVPGNVRELRFMPTSYEEGWLTEQVQVLIQRLVQAAGTASEHMPDYASMPARSATEETVFPVSFIGRGDKEH